MIRYLSDGRVDVGTSPFTNEEVAELVDRLDRAVADNAALREQVEAFRREQIARSKIDPVTRLHNLCDHLADQRRESPFTAESLELADASYKELCADNAALRAELKRQNDANDMIAQVRDAYEKDAKRYRWLKLHGLHLWQMESGMNDAAIDALLAGKELK